MTITEAKREDLEEILALQYLAYESEARLLGNWSIPPLLQTLEEACREYDGGIFLKACDSDGKIVGSVRGYPQGDTLLIGKLMVHPEHRGRGLGTKLLTELEAACPHRRYELFTSDKSAGNLRLYQRLSYVRFREREVAPDLRFIYLEKREVVHMESKIGFIGAGNMAGAIIGGVTAKGLYTSGQIGIYDISPETRQRYADAGHVVFEEVEALVAACDMVVLSVKPQVFPAVLPQVKKAMTPQKVLVSIAAGITAEIIQGAVGFPCKLVLVMPNTPLLVGKGAAALSRVEPTTSAEFEAVRALFTSAGITEEVDAARMDAVMPVHGSSPAFLYLFAKTMVECAEEAGVDPAAATRLFCQTMVGAAEMMTQSGKPFQELIDMVCSPGGATLAALAAMEENGFARSIREGYAACVRRAEELAK